MVMPSSMLLMYLKDYEHNLCACVCLCASFKGRSCQRHPLVDFSQELCILLLCERVPLLISSVTYDFLIFTSVGSYRLQCVPTNR